MIHVPGIYHLDGDCVMLYIADEGPKRSTEFVTRPNDGRFLLVSKREK